MMTNFEACFRLLITFIVCVLFVSQVNASKLFPQNAEKNLTQSQHWESPAAMVPMNHAYNSNVNIRSRNLQAAIPSAGILKNEAQQLQPTQNNFTDIIVSNVLRFTLNVGSELSENAYFSKSEVFSPVSIMSALALLFAGAKGTTYQQLKPIFGFDQYTTFANDPNFAQMLHREFGTLLQDVEQENFRNMQRRNSPKWRDTSTRSADIRILPLNEKPIVHIIKIANGLFAQNGYNLNPNYKNVISTIYHSELSMLDFHGNGEAARQYINAWVSKNTFNKIPNIIENNIAKSTNLILASVLYFKGFWENTFFQDATALDNFYPDGEGRPGIKVPMMVTGGVFPYYEAHEYNCRIIGLPYRGNLSTMYVIQPKDSSRANLKDFQKNISPDAIEDMISKMKQHTAILAFPKLHLIKKLNLKEILQRFGVIDMFVNGVSDLSLIGSSTQKLNPTIANNVNKIPNILQNRPWAAASAMHSTPPKYTFTDRYHEAPLYFSSRFGEIGNSSKLNVTDEIEIQETTTILNNIEEETTTIANDDNESITTTEKTITQETQTSTTKNETMEKSRVKRQTNDPLELLEAERLINNNGPIQSDLYVDDVFHKVDFEVNEQGTEAAAATIVYLRRSGTDVVFRADTPFMLLLRHDPTKLVLFYAIVNEPEI